MQKGVFMQTTVWQPEAECYRAFLPLDLPPEATFVYRNNNNMATSVPNPNVYALGGMDWTLESHDMVVAGDVQTGRYVLAGALTANRSMTYFTVIRKGRLVGISVRQPFIKPGEQPEELLVLEGPDWRELMIQYADAAAKKMGVKPIDATKNITGYCTWYYYYADVSEKNLLDNLAALKSNRDPYAAQVVQIDDGYQTHQGDWLDQRDAWPTPLKTIAEEITSAGMEAGIWTMPMLASTASRVFKEHPDWFVKDEKGEPLAIRGWSPPPDHHWLCLDATLPAVQEHLAQVFQTFRSWGYTYFKMDGLGYGLAIGRRHDPDATPVSAFRLALKAIRNAVPDATLLGCCPPFMPCLGLVDNCRVSGDTSRYYYAKGPDYANFDADTGCSIRHAMHVTMANWWKYDRWFRCDPDTLMARQDNAFYTYGEAKMSVLTGIITGVCITSDNLGTIAPDRLALLGRAQELRLKDATPFEWPMDYWPQVFTGTVNGRKAVAIFNDCDHEMTYEFDKYGLPEECDELLDVPSVRKKKIILPAHDAALIVAK